jgi:hypothetical protein
VELNGNGLRALRAKLDGALDGVLIENNIYPAIATMQQFNDAHQTLSRAATRQIESYVGEWPLLIIGYSLLADALAVKYEYDKDASPIQLVNLLDRGEIEAVTESVFDTIAALPVDYEIVIPLKSPQIRQLLFAEQHSINVTDQVRFFCTDLAGVHNDRHGEAEPPDTLATLVRGTRRWNPQYTYFGRKASGYVSNYFTTAPVMRGVSLFKELLGIGVARGVLDVERVASTGSFFREHIQIYASTGGENTWAASVACSDAVGSLVGSIKAHPDALKTSGRERDLILKRFVSGLSATCQDGEGATRLRRSAAWYLDSRLNADEVLSFIQAVTCLEVVLGDKALSDRIGLGSLLANRCAYQVAVSAGDRANVLDEFKNIYEKRSRILHGGHDHLSGNDRAMVRTAQFLCTRTLNSELRLLVNENLPYDERWR